jgi:serine/threonine protein phosphatase PrpC
VSAQPFSLRVPISKSDKFVIVGCDGVWDVITEQVG